MKTALELLGADAFVACLPVAGAHPLSSAGAPDAEGWVRLLELVAQRAREEMREAAAREARDWACDKCQHGPCAAMRLAEGRIRELPVKP